MKLFARAIRALGWYDHRELTPIKSLVPDNVGMIPLATIETTDDLTSALDACIRAYVENLDTADLDTYMGVMEALDTIKRRVLKTLLSPEGDPQ